MKQKISLVVAILILILPITFYALFKTPFNQGATKAAVGQPTVLEFSTPLCSECQKLKKVLDKVEPKYKKDITFQKINANMMDNATMTKVQKYNVRVVPTTVFLDRTGELAMKKEGAMSEEALSGYLDELLK